MSAERNSPSNPSELSGPAQEPETRRSGDGSAPELTVVMPPRHDDGRVTTEVAPADDDGWQPA